MTRVFPFAGVFLVFIFVAYSHAQRLENRQGSRRPVASQADLLAEQVAKDIRDARKAASSVTDRRLRERLELLLSRAELKAVDLQKELAKQSSSRFRPYRAITQEEFDRVLRDLKKESFDDDKVQFIENFVKGRPLNCTQAAEIVRALSFGDGRKKAAIALYPSLVDPQDFYKVLQVLSFDSEREEVRKSLKLK